MKHGARMLVVMAGLMGALSATPAQAQESEDCRVARTALENFADQGGTDEEYEALKAKVAECDAAAATPPKDRSAGKCKAARAELKRAKKSRDSRAVRAAQRKIRKHC